MNETNLYKEFIRQKGDVGQMSAHARSRRKSSWEKSIETEKMIRTAAELSYAIKDVSDELNILRSIAKSQEMIQREQYGKESPPVDNSAAYVCEDISEMYKMASRIQNAVRSNPSSRKMT